MSRLAFIIIIRLLIFVSISAHQDNHTNHINIIALFPFCTFLCPRIFQRHGSVKHHFLRCTIRIY